MPDFDCNLAVVPSPNRITAAYRLTTIASGRTQVTGFDIPHNFPTDYTPVFGMDVRGCVGYYAATYPQGADWSDQVGEAIQISGIDLPMNSTLGRTIRSQVCLPCELTDWEHAGFWYRYCHHVFMLQCRQCRAQMITRLNRLAPTFEVHHSHSS